MYPASATASQNPYIVALGAMSSMQLDAGPKRTMDNRRSESGHDPMETFHTNHREDLPVANRSHHVIEPEVRKQHWKAPTVAEEQGVRYRHHQLMESRGDMDRDTITELHKAWEFRHMAEQVHSDRHDHLVARGRVEDTYHTLLTLSRLPYVHREHKSFQMQYAYMDSVLGECRALGETFCLWHMSQTSEEKQRHVQNTMQAVHALMHAMHVYMSSCAHNTSMRQNQFGKSFLRRCVPLHEALKGTRTPEELRRMVGSLTELLNVYGDDAHS